MNNMINTNETPPVVTLRINSYRNANTFLKDGKILFSANMTQNHKDNSPIISSVSNIIESLQSEMNQNISLYVTGNAFERALMAFKCEQNKEFIVGYESSAPTIPLSTQERLVLLEQLGCTAISKIAVSVLCKGVETDVNLPTYPLVEFVSSAPAHIVIVSDNIDTIHRELRYGAEECAFYIGGQSEEYEGQYIIGCTADNVNELVRAYIETKYINPLVGELFAQLRDVDNRSKHILINCTEPHYYSTLPLGHPLKLYDDSSRELPISFTTINPDGMVISGLPDTTRLTRRYKLPDGTFVDDEAADLSKISNLSPGEYDLCVYFEDSAPFAEFHIVVEKAIYVSCITIDVDINNDDPLVVGQAYKYSLTIEPECTKDGKDVVLCCSNTDVAEIVGDEIIIKSDGVFSLIAEATKTKARVDFVARTYTVEMIQVSDWPRHVVRGGTWFRAFVDIQPYQANKGGFSFEVVKGGRTVEAHKEAPNSNFICVDAKRRGAAIFRFTSNDDPNVSCEKKLKIKAGSRPLRKSIFAKTALGLTVLTAILLLFRATTLFWASIGLTVAALVISCIRNEESAWAGVALEAVFLVAAILLHTYVFYPIEKVETAADIPAAVLSEIKADAHARVLDKDYQCFIDWSTTSKHKASKTTCLGYYFLRGEKRRAEDNIVYLLYEVEATSISSLTDAVIYAAVPYQNFEAKRDDTYTYETEDILDFETFEELETEILTEQLEKYAVETYISDEVYYGQLNMPRYVFEEKEIPQQTVDAIVERYSNEITSGEKDSNTTSIFTDPKFYGTTWTFADSPFAEKRNTLIIYLYREQYRDGVLTDIYYYPVVFANVTQTTDGAVVLNVEDGELQNPATTRPVVG